MSQDAKVVRIRDTTGDALIHLPAPLIRLRDLSANALRRLLGEFFDNSDDALFNMADKAGSNQEQAAYFDAMRELRMRRKDLTLSMQQWTARAFNEIGRFSPRSGNDGAQDLNRDVLTLVDDQVLEEQVALDNMVTKARNRYGELLKLLEYRVDSLMSGADIVPAQMPLSPEVFCFGLGEACADLTIDIRAKLIVFKLFDKLMVARLEQLYREANDFLVREGILPHMKRVPLTGKAHRAAATGSAPMQASSAGGTLDGGGRIFEAGDSGGTFSELSALLHNGQAGVGPGLLAGGAAGGSVLATPDLVSLLSRAQPDFFQSGRSEAEPLRLQACIGQIVGAAEGRGSRVGQVDADVINLVAMLFDFILEDRQLPPRMKALLGRLQIPVLKVALLDRGFFNRGGHPARKLLNELAMAAIGWNEKTEGQRDPLLAKVENIVEQLLNEFTDNIGLFDELLQDFQHFMGLEQRRRELVEQRLRDVEEGRARQEQARSRVEAAIARQVENHELPESTHKLLTEPWAKFLQWTFLRKGEDSVEWSAALTLTGQLVWTLDPKPITDETRKEMLRIIPGVVDGIRSGLRTIAWDPFATDAIIRDLEMAHVDALQTLPLNRRAPAAREQTPLADAVKPDLTENHEPDSGPALAKGPETRDGEAAAMPGDAGRETAAAPQPEMPVPQVPAEQESTAPSTAACPAGQWLAEARALRVGSWLELVNEGNRVRCKLAAIIKATGKYIFVNRSGAKVAEYNLDRVAAALEEGHIAILDDGLIFDRALESIIDNLRSNRRD